MGSNELRRRMEGCAQSRQITEALRLIAVNRQRRAALQLHRVQPYAQALTAIMARVQPQIVPKQQLSVIFASDMGLCNDYLSALRKAAFARVHGPSVIIGRKAAGWRLPDARVIARSSYALDVIVREITPQTAVQVLYTVKVNALRYEPRLVRIWPLPPEKQTLLQEPCGLWQPLREQYLHASLQRCAWEAECSEHALRAMAMETASENAKQLIEELRRARHRQRQAQITREITEMSSMGAMDDE